MFVKFDIRGFDPSYSSIVMSLIWSDVTGSDESGWDHVDCEAVPPMSSYFASPSQLCQVILPAVVLCRKGRPVAVLCSKWRPAAVLCRKGRPAVVLCRKGRPAAVLCRKGRPAVISGCCFLLQKVRIFLRTNFNAFYAIWGYSKRPSPTLCNFLEKIKFSH